MSLTHQRVVVQFATALSFCVLHIVRWEIDFDVIVIIIARGFVLFLSSADDDGLRTARKSNPTEG